MRKQSDNKSNQLGYTWLTKAKLFLSVCLLTGFASHAQTVTIPDSAFCQCLLEKQPQVLNSQKELIILEAIKVTTLDCQGRGIKSVEGLQYFIKASYIGLSRNNIDSLPDLDGYNLPFSANALFILDLGENKIKTLPKLPSTLPIVLDLKTNNLSELPSISLPQNIRSLNLQRNKGMELPDLSEFTNLQQLYVDNNAWTTLPDISTTKLKALGASSNQLTSLPNLSAFPDLGFLRCEDNYLDFADLLNVTNPKLFTNGKANADFWYSPQKPSGVASTQMLNIGDSYTIDKSSILGGPNTTFSWYKNDTLINPAASTKQLTVSAFNKAKTGFYTLKMTDPKFDKLTLSSGSVLLRLSGNENATVPDAGFRNCIRAINPALLDANEDIVPSEASKIKFMQCNDYGIQRLQGMEYFTGLEAVNMQRNQIEVLPTLPATVQVLYLDEPLLQTVTNFPDSLYIVYMYNAKVKSIPNFPGGFTHLILHETELTSIPTLPSTLKVLDLIGNKGISSLPGLNNTVNTLELFQVSDNSVPTAPDLSGFQSLNNVYINENNWSGLKFNNSKVSIFQAMGNRFVTVPDLNPALVMTHIRLDRNKLTFADLMKLDVQGIQKPSAQFTYTYENQDSLGTKITTTLNQGANFTIDLDVDDALTSNVYKWFLNGDSLTTSNSNIFTISNFDVFKEGVYTCRVTNPAFPALTLVSRPVTLNATSDQHILIPDANFRQCLRDSMPQVLDINGRLIPNQAAEIRFLTCEKRQIKDLEAVQYFTGLATLNCRENELTTIPDLSGITSGDVYGFQLFCNSNQLTALPNMPFYTVSIVAMNNRITSIANIENLDSLQLLMIGNNKELAVPNLSNFKDLYIFECIGNDWNTMPNLSSNTKMSDLFIADNNFESLTDLNALVNLRYLSCVKNKLTFSDLLNVKNPLLIALAPNPRLIYHPQDSVGAAANVLLAQGANYTIDLYIDDTVTTNVYKWFRNGNLIATTTNNSFTISNAAAIVSGVYTCEITNTLLTNLTLYSRPVAIGISPWTAVIAGQKNHVVAVPSNVSSNIKGEKLAAGDVLGIFFNQNGTLICGGYQMWNDTGTTLTAYGMTTSPKNGFDTQESFVLKVWKANLNREFTLKASYDNASPNVDGKYADNALSSIVSLNFDTCAGQGVSLYKGWNLISLNVEPNDLAMNKVLEGISPVIVKNAAGAIQFAPQNGITTGTWNTQEGYLVYVIQFQNLFVCGTSINTNTTIAIPNNPYPYFLPYFHTTERSVTQMVGGVESNLSYVQSMEYTSAANAILAYNYVPNHVISPAIDQIGNMKPGLAYKVMATAPFSFSYASANARLEEPAPKTGSQVSQYFGLPEVITGNNTVVVLPTNVFFPPLKAGDEVGVFAPNGKLSGSSVFDGSNMAITVWENSSMQHGNQFKFKVWRNETSELSVAQIPFASNNGSYHSNAILVAGTTVTAVEKSEETASTISCFPNPASSELFLKLSDGLGNAQVTIVNSLGNLVERFATNSSVEHRIDCSQLANGMYMVTVKTAAKEMKAKFVVNK